VTSVFLSHRGSIDYCLETPVYGWVWEEVLPVLNRKRKRQRYREGETERQRGWEENGERGRQKDRDGRQTVVKPRDNSNHGEEKVPERFT
jgi:hypothetical protein